MVFQGRSESMSFYGIGSSDFFGQSFGVGSTSLYNSTSSTSSSVSLGDWSMIKSGSYKKLLTAYYTSEAYNSSASVESDKNSVDSSKKNMTVVNDASSLVNKTNQVTNLLNKYATRLRVATGEEKEKIAEDLFKAAKEYVNTYNASLDSAALSNNTAVLRSGVNMTTNTKANAKLLDKLGITIGSDNKLSIDEDKFKKADMNSLSTLFTGASSYASHIKRSATIIGNVATADIAKQNKACSYTSSGSFINMTGAISSYNSKI